jgi:hypothetical protein
MHATLPTYHSKSNKWLTFNLPKPLETSIPIARCLCEAFTNVQNGILYEDKLQADVSYTIKWQSIVFTNIKPPFSGLKSKTKENKKKKERR